MKNKYNRNSHKPPVIFLMGPTAAGKTELALELVQRIPAEIISVDSAMIYRGLDIGTGKPTPEQLQQNPHHLIDIRDPSESYSAGEFCQDAKACMQTITAKNKIPLLVGGTFLYFHALLQGLSHLPSANAALRAAIEQEALSVGWQKMHEKLAKIDPLAAKRIHPNDPQRISRALEVYEITGKPLSFLWDDNANNRDSAITAGLQDYHIYPFALIPRDRANLHQRIAVRFHTMLAQGFIEEVQTLRKRSDLHLNLPSMRAVGYRQIWQYLDTLDALQSLNALHSSAEETSHFIADHKQLHASMIEKCIAATRQLAKRQLTWLRNSKEKFSPANTPSSAQNLASTPNHSIAHITYLEIENSYLDSLQTMVHCVS